MNRRAAIHLAISLSALLLLAPLAIRADPPSAKGSTARSKAQIAVARASGKVDHAAVAEIEGRGRARLLVGMAIDPPSQPRSRGSQRRSRIANARDRILARLASDPETNAQLRHRYAEVAAFAIEAGPATLERLALDPDVAFVAFDAPGAGHLAAAIPLAKIDVAQANGASGAGVTIAVIDSGIDTDHPDFAGAIVGEQCFCSDQGAGCCPGGGATQSGAGAAEDDHGHGTNVSGILAGRGAVAAAGGAPAAEIVSIKVLDSNNSFCCVSDVVAALDYLIESWPEVDIVNMSLGTFSLFPGDCDAVSFNSLLADPIDTLRANGVLVFASSGNEGSATSMSSPACVTNTVSVAASWDSDLGSQSLPFFNCSDTTTGTDVVTCFSNTNDRTDLVAPGAPTTASGLFGGTSTFYGTSQASPLAASCAALLREASPAATPDEIEAALESAPVLLVDEDNDVALPRLDCMAALNRCGNGALNPAEACDDGNFTPGDGCDATCRIEPGFDCTGEPSSCTPVFVGRAVAGRRTLIKNRVPEDPLRNRFMWVSRDDSVAMPAPGSPGDPRCASVGGGGAGGALSVSSDASGEGFTAPLPCEGWRLLGDPAEPRGYKYIDHDRSLGPCRSAVLRDGVSIRSRCSGAGVQFDLNPGVSQEPLRVRLTTGGALRAHCAEFGGDVYRDGSDGTTFLTRRSSPPATCP